MTDLVRNNLPLQLTSFIGREREINEVKRLLATTRLLTLTGAGGCGKTRLALRVAADLRDEFPDGVWFVDLAPLSDPAVVPQTIASVFDLRESGATSPIELLKNFFHAKNLLLVLDNCEHLIQACAEFADNVLRTAPQVRILATSREPLNIAGETNFRVPSLSLPDPNHLAPLETLAQSEAVRLFIERASAARFSFALTEQNAPIIAKICQRLDGIPLAIELAATRVNSLSVEQIAARLDDVFQLLISGSRTALPRNQTLRATMDWSHELLTEPERTLFRRLGVFVGGWTLQAAEFVARDGYNVLDTQSRLVDKSLVLPREMDDGVTRYRLLEPIRQYAHDKLLESGEADQVHSRHLDFFLGFAEEAKAKLQGAEQFIFLNQRRSEYENLRTAIEWARGDDSHISNSEHGLRLLNALEHLGDVYVLLGVGTQAVTFYQDAIALCNRLAGMDKMIPLRLHSKIVETANILQWRVDLPRFEAANQIGEASLSTLKAELQLAENLAPDPELVRLLTQVSRAAGRMKVSPDWDAAGRYARAAVDMAEKLDAPIELSTALSCLADVFSSQGLCREVVQTSLRRLTLSRDPRFDVRERIYVLLAAAYALSNVGEFAQAMPHLTQAATLADQIQAPEQQKAILERSAYCLFCLDRWDEMLKTVEQLRNIQNRYSRERVGPMCFPIALAASVHARRGEFDSSAAERREAQAIMTATSGPVDRWARAQVH